MANHLEELPPCTTTRYNKPWPKQGVIRLVGANIYVYSHVLPTCVNLWLHFRNCTHFPIYLHSLTAQSTCRSMPNLQAIHSSIQVGEFLTIIKVHYKTKSSIEMTFSATRTHLGIHKLVILSEYPAEAYSAHDLCKIHVIFKTCEGWWCCLVCFYFTRDALNSMQRINRSSKTLFCH